MAVNLPAARIGQSSAQNVTSNGKRPPAKAIFAHLINLIVVPATLVRQRVVQPMAARTMLANRAIRVNLESPVIPAQPANRAIRATLVSPANGVNLATWIPVLPFHLLLLRSQKRPVVFWVG
jgi:hypothetical protein